MEDKRAPQTAAGIAVRLVTSRSIVQSRALARARAVGSADSLGIKHPTALKRARTSMSQHNERLAIMARPHPSGKQTMKQARAEFVMHDKRSCQRAPSCRKTNHQLPEGAKLIEVAVKAVCRAGDAVADRARQGPLLTGHGKALAMKSLFLCPTCRITTSGQT